jgi:hypothetical protein
MIVVQAANQISTNMCMQYTRCNNGGVATITVQYSMVRLVDVQVTSMAALRPMYDIRDRRAYVR